ncbi:MAG TPA: hypothetical protein VNQ14_02650, partial [Woeseiaceae bacterium]|nr:hypothetical protein [Woeseiaceae bacterium]
MGNTANVSSAVLPGQDQHVLDFQARPRALSLSISAVAAAILVSTGTLVLTAWILDLDAVKSLSSSWVTMKANAALSFILAGVALHLLTGGRGDSGARIAGRVAAAASVVIGALTFGQYLSGIDLRIDELLLQQPTTAVDMARPGRMAAAAAVGFMLLGTALLCHGSGGRVARAVSVGLALVVAAMAVVVVATYLVDVESLYARGPVTSMALHTAVLFGVAALGIVAARPDRSSANGHRAALSAAAAEEASRRRVL